MLGHPLVPSGNFAPKQRSAPQIPSWYPFSLVFPFKLDQKSGALRLPEVFSRYLRLMGRLRSENVELSDSESLLARHVFLRILGREQDLSQDFLEGRAKAARHLLVRFG